MARDKVTVPTERIERAILLIRGQKVLLDRDLAELYRVETRVLNQAVRRNRKRFPEDFMFQLTGEELENWMSQFVTSNPGAKMGLRKRPYAFTEHGAAMLSSVLSSDRAIEVNIAIMRAFVRMREFLATHSDLARRLDELERKYDSQFKVVFDAIRQLMAPTPTPSPRRRIGFQSPGGERSPKAKRREPPRISRRALAPVCQFTEPPNRTLARTG
ncbi:MAG: ORF6N domain-containing protein [Planctomycetes bacterium]|nr:ORF6N domain-containing protein [Planctomycetota bacterium]